MSEIYRDKTGQAVDLGVTGATSVSANFIKGGATYTGTVIGTIATIPYAVVSSDGLVRVEWTFTVEGNVYNRIEDFSVVTPLFNKPELVESNSTFSTLTDAQVVTLERFVRLIIEAYTGQSFGLEYGSAVLYGDGTAVLHSDRRIISLESPYADYPYRVIMNGYAVETSWPLRGEFITPTLEGGEPYRQIITNPYAYRPFSNNLKYTITGTFGWASIPQEVKEAALVLAGEFSCNEATWRDRYIKSIRAADWRFDFDSRAYSGTGSASADLLLAKFVVNRMAVI